MSIPIGAALHFSNYNKTTASGPRNSTYVIHLFKELSRLVERHPVVADRVAELVPLALQLVDVGAQLAIVAAASGSHQRVGRVGEVAHLALDGLDGPLELAERLQRHAYGSQRIAVGTATRVELALQFVEFAVQLKMNDNVLFLSISQDSEVYIVYVFSL